MWFERNFLHRKTRFSIVNRFKPSGKENKSAEDSSEDFDSNFQLSNLNKFPQWKISWKISWMRKHTCCRCSYSFHQWINYWSEITEIWNTKRVKNRIAFETTLDTLFLRLLFIFLDDEQHQFSIWITFEAHNHPSFWCWCRITPKCFMYADVIRDCCLQHEWWWLSHWR